MTDQPGPSFSPRRPGERDGGRAASGERGERGARPAEAVGQDGVASVGRPSKTVPADVEPLWREALGRRLRDARRRQGRTLAETARRAGISTQYLSEVERGRKDASSEIIAAIAGALDHSLGEIAWTTAADLLIAAGLTAAGRPALAGGIRLRRMEPIGGRRHRIDGPRRASRPLGPVALAA